MKDQTPARLSLSWLNGNLLFVLSLFLLAFIPLFPKIPLLDAIPGYIVKVRIEDLLVIFTGLVWLRDVRQKRIQWNTSYFWFVLLYGATGVLSIVLGVILMRTIPPELLHIGKSGLHLFRYLEYFTLFFFLFSSVKHKWQVNMAIIVMVLTMLGVVAYGIGQKYLRFPVYSTMNREYSKGEKLFLQEGARPQSTFAGHYDLAAYLVIVLPIIFSLGVSSFKPPFELKKISLGVLLGVAGTAGLVMLVLSGSKTAIAAFGLSSLVVLFLHWLNFGGRKLRFQSASIFIIFAIVGGLIGWSVMPTEFKTKIQSAAMRLQLGAKELPSDLIGDGYEEKIISTVQPDGMVKQTRIRVKSTWSPNALKYGLSMAIRLDTLWPQALLGLARNPLTGSGFGTLAMLDTGLFAEADSTDNNYLRVLGETGILGFIAFYGLVLFVLREAYLFARKGTDLSSLSIGLCGSIIGLLISAIYLDIFAASKVAFIFWAVTGLILKSGKLERPQELTVAKLTQPVLNLMTGITKLWPLILVLILAFFLLHQNPFMTHNPTKDIDVRTAGLEEITSARCFVTNRSFSLCRNSGLVLKPYVTPYTILLFPWIGSLKNPGVFYYTNILLVLAAISVSYLIIRKEKRENIFIGLLTGVGVASLLRLSSFPLDPVHFLLTILLIPVVSIGTCFLLQGIKKEILLTSFRYLIIGLFIVVLGKVIITGDIFLRFCQLVPNDAFTAIQESNGVLESKPGAPAYLATTLNPYYVDQYTIDKYQVLPLSMSQPYVSVMDRVWGVPITKDLKDLYVSLVDSSAQVFVSDYGIKIKPQYEDAFKDIKKDFDLSYIHLGCEERCNLYSLKKATPILSTDISTPYNGRVLRAQDFPPSYQFSVISNRFDSSLADKEARTTVSFAQDLASIHTEQQQFLVFTGDVGEKPEGVYTKLFMDAFATPTKLPLLYAAGNADQIPSKDVDGGHKEFFTNNEFFITLRVDRDSTLNTTEQLKFYNSLLKLEKLPRIKTLFIISHDLNWQDKSNPKSAVRIIERKLRDFPYIKTVIITANHNPDLKVNSNWFEMKEDKQKNITYVASLTAGNVADVYTQVSIGDDGKLTIQGTNLRR